MGRYVTETTDKAAELEKWVKELGEETNSKVEGAELFDVGLDIREPSELNGKKYFNGFVSLKIDFIDVFKRAPNFLTEQDEELWYKKLKQIAREKFGVDTLHLHSMAIDFEEPSEEELYDLTENKKRAIEEGFKRVKRYINFYFSAVRKYNQGIVDSHTEKMNKYLSDLETIASD